MITRWGRGSKSRSCCCACSPSLANIPTCTVPRLQFLTEPRRRFWHEMPGKATRLPSARPSRGCTHRRGPNPTRPVSWQSRSGAVHTFFSGWISILQKKKQKIAQKGNLNCPREGEHSVGLLLEQYASSLCLGRHHRVAEGALLGVRALALSFPPCGTPSPRMQCVAIPICATFFLGGRGSPRVFFFWRSGSSRVEKKNRTNVPV